MKTDTKMKCLGQWQYSTLRHTGINNSNSIL